MQLFELNEIIGICILAAINIALHIVAWGTKINQPKIWRIGVAVILIFSIAIVIMMYSDNKKTQDEKQFQMDHYGAGHRADNNISFG